MDIQAIKNEIEDLRFNEYYIDDNKIDVCKLYKILDKYDTKDMIIIPHNSNKEVPEELKTILKLSTDVTFLKDDVDTLNKGIDELIKKYEEEKQLALKNSEENKLKSLRAKIKERKTVYWVICLRQDEKVNVLKKIITDLKKLKGE